MGTARLPSNGSLKIGVGLLLGGVAIGCLLLSRLALFAFVLALCLVATGEMHRLARSRGARPLPVVAFAAVVALFVLAYVKPLRFSVLAPAVLAGALGVLFLAAAFRRRREGILVGLAVTMFSILYVGLFGAYIVSMRRQEFGMRVVLVFGLMAVLNDAGAFFVGRRFGRRKLAPSVSPDKTWEGVAGGTAATFAVAAVASWLLNPPFPTVRAFVLAALVAVAAPVGDLVESTVKRDIGVKDAGGVVPGHGGVLDRLDSVLFAAPIFWYAYRAFVS